jgi:hypothetical protein
MRNQYHTYLLSLLCLSILLGTGCFSIPFIGGGGPPKEFEPQDAMFDSTNVFVGYNGDDQPIVEIRLIDQEVTFEGGLVVNARLFTTENFEVVNIFRGLRSINYYPIERRFHRLELRHGRRKVKMKVNKNLQVKGDKPVDATFEHTGRFTMLPDTISTLKLKFQDVDRWAKMPADTLEEWYASKDQFFKQAERRRQRGSLVDSYRRRQKDDYTKTFTQYDSLYVTTNNAYIFLQKDVNSDILYTVNAGEKLDYGVSDGIWVEVPTPDSLLDKLELFFEARQQAAINKRDMQRKRARSSRTAVVVEEVDTTYKSTGYMLDVMAQKRLEIAIAWEKENKLPPVDVPLFAQVLGDRELAVIARRDSIESARQDSIRAIEDSLAALATAADSSAAAQDSTVAPAAAVTATDTVAASGNSSPAATASPAAAAANPVQSGQAAPDSSATGEIHRVVGPEGQVWEGRGPPPWAGRNRMNMDGGPPKAPATADTTATDGAAEPDSSTESGGRRQPGNGD